MSLRTFLTENKRWLGAGMLMSAGSGFGQTYFISIYGGHIREEFGLSHGGWGGVYTIGTMLSAALMLWAGPLVDRATVRQVSTWVFLMFAGVCVAMAVNNSATLLILVIFGLRFCGQGMLSHVPMVAAGRWFAASRGRAVSIIALGFSLAESTLPFIFVSLAFAFGWRTSWLVAAGLVLLMIPALRTLLRTERTPQGDAEKVTSTGMEGRHWSRRDALSHWLFWMILPAFMVMPVFGTAFFFQQVHLNEVKGWPLESFVAVLPLLSLSAIISMLLTGAAIDKFGAGPLVPLLLLPFAAGQVVFSFGTGFETVFFGFVLLGTAGGMISTLSGTFWPEYYGTGHLGAIRSVATSTMVFSSALGPGLTGALIDQGIAYETQMLWIAGLSIASAALALVGLTRARPLLSASA